MAIGDILEKHCAKDIRHQKMPDGDKTRYNFSCEESENAVNLFRQISKTS